MKIRTKAEALASIVPIENTVKGRKYSIWQADCGTADGKRIRISRASKSACSRAVEDWFRTHQECGDAIAHLTPVQVSEAVMCYDALRRAGKPLRLLPIVESHIAANRDKPRKTIGDAYEEYLASFSDLQTATISNVRRRVGSFVATVRGKMLSEVSASDVRAFLDGLRAKDGVSPCAPKTWNMNMTDIRTFFNWCCKRVRRYMDENPIADMEEKPEPSKIPEYAAVKEVRKLFAYVYREYNGKSRDALVYRFALSFFLGIRSEEIDRIALDDVRLDGGSILIRQPKGSQHGITHRVVPINDTAKAWLTAIDMGKVSQYEGAEYNTMVKAMTAARKKSKAKLPHNAGRHSFATYHVAAYGDISKTATILGNSPVMIRSHYQGLADKATGEAYFGITPGTV